MDNSSILSSVEALDGGGGNITLNTTSLRLDQSQILARADQGDGGRITISPPAGIEQERYLVDAASRIDAQSQSGTSGDVQIANPDTAVNSVVPSQNTRIEDVPEFDSSSCGAPKPDAPSTLVVQGNQQFVLPPDTRSGFLPGSERFSTQDADFSDRTADLRNEAFVSSCFDQALLNRGAD